MPTVAVGTFVLYLGLTGNAHADSPSGYKLGPLNNFHRGSDKGFLVMLRFLAPELAVDLANSFWQLVRGCT